MRFEKLNENKIKITLTSQDLIKSNIDYHTFMANPIESQDLFFSMLDKAEKEIGFDTKNYQIRIEAFQIAESDFVLTVTRSLPEEEKEKKKLHVRRKQLNNFKNNQIVYCFDTFDDFCNFTEFINNNSIDFSNIAKNIALYEYNKLYYLSFTNINLISEDIKKLFTCITEFANYISSSDIFKSKLIENGNLIMKNNAIKLAMQYFIS